MIDYRFTILNALHRLTHLIFINNLVIGTIIILIIPNLLF